MDIESIIKLLDWAVALVIPFGMFVYNKINKKFSEFTKTITYLNDEINRLNNLVSILESEKDRGMPYWIRTSDGIIKSVSGEFVRLFGAPNGYSAKDMVGKRFDELTNFNQDLIDVLRDLDTRARTSIYAVANNVKISDEITATIGKRVVPYGHDNFIFVGIVIPEIE